MKNVYNRAYRTFKLNQFGVLNLIDYMRGSDIMGGTTFCEYVHNNFNNIDFHNLNNNMVCIFITPYPKILFIDCESFYLF